MAQSKFIKELEKLTGKKVVLKENTLQQVEITQDLFYVEENIKEKSENLAEALGAPRLITAQELIDNKVNVWNMTHPVYRSLGRYIRLYLKKGTRGTYDGEVFFGGNRESSLDSSWYKVIGSLKENDTSSMAVADQSILSPRKKQLAMYGYSIIESAEKKKKLLKENKIETGVYSGSRKEEGERMLSGLGFLGYKKSGEEQEQRRSGPGYTFVVTCQVYEHPETKDRFQITKVWGNNGYSQPFQDYIKIETLASGEEPRKLGPSQEKSRSAGRMIRSYHR